MKIQKTKRKELMSIQDELFKKYGTEEVIKSITVAINGGVYTQLYNQGYFDDSSVDKIKQQYSDTKHWRVIVLD